MAFTRGPWTAIAWLISAANLVAVWFAARSAEPWQASLHALLALLFGLWARHPTARQPAG